LIQPPSLHQEPIGLQSLPTLPASLDGVVGNVNKTTDETSSSHSAMQMSVYNDESKKEESENKDNQDDDEEEFVLFEG
jgi:hypothetical protein